MGDIYSTAQRIVAWLGPSDSLSELAADVFEHVINQRGKARLFSWKEVEAIVAWSWYRIWTIQEIILARRLTFYCGHRIFEGEDIYYIALYLRKHDWLRAPSLPLSAEELILWCELTGEPLIASIVFSWEQRSSVNFLLPLEDWISKTGQSQCSDLRDHVYALLGISFMFIDGISDSAGLSPNYEISHMEVFEQVMGLCMARRNWDSGDPSVLIIEKETAIYPGQRLDLSHSQMQSALNSIIVREHRAASDVGKLQEWKDELVLAM